MTTTVYFYSKDIQECRNFLYSFGMNCSHKGWNSGTKAGIIDWDDKQKQWYAAVWNT